MKPLVHVADDWLLSGVSIHMAERGARGSVVFDFSNVTSVAVQADDSVSPETNPLRLSNEMALALYVALADHFGHSGNDTRALRRDYEAERARVDKFIAHIVGAKT